MSLNCTTWAPADRDISAWSKSFLNRLALVAEEEGKIIGFGDIDGTGYLDRLYVHKDFQRKGIATAIVSNKLDPAVRELHEHFFKELVDTAVGESSERQAKPSPDMVNEALRRLGIDAESAVYVGDSEVDIMTARNAGMRCISVSWGFKTREFLVQNGASSIAGTVEELMEQIDRA